MKKLKKIWNEKLPLIKKISAISWVVLLCLFVWLYVGQRKQRETIKMYNRGNECINMELYDIASCYYEFAYDEDPTSEQICSIRINQALADVIPLTPDYINEDNITDVIETLENARDNLVQDGCANMNDNNGHSKDAQTLKNEIDAYIEELRKEYDLEDTSESQDSKDDNQNGEDEKQEHLRQTFEDVQREGMTQRSKEMGLSESSKEDYVYYDGKNW